MKKISLILLGSFITLLSHAQQIQQQGRTPVHGVDEQFKKIIKKVVSEILNK